MSDDLDDPFGLGPADCIPLSGEPKDIADRFGGFVDRVAPENIDANDVFLRHGPEAIREAFAKARPAPTRLPLIDIATWQGEPPPRRSLWGEMLPLMQTTMLTGMGGVGKSLFAQALLTHIALGRPFLGAQVEQRNALYLTCEDDSDELWRRQAAICATLGVPLADVVGKLFLASLTGAEATALATFDASGRAVPTDLWAHFKTACAQHDVGVFAFDNATDAMAGDLNDIHQVAEFVNLLTGLAIAIEGVALLVHHPNKAGDEWLGSVAWHNKVRSRLIIGRTDDGDPDARTVSNPKANYGPSGGKIDFRWHRGSFVRDDDLPADVSAELARSIAVSGENEAFLRCLRARAEQGEARGVGPSPGPNYAPSQFEPMPEAKGYRREALKRAMERLFAIGRIEVHTYRNASKARDVSIIREVGANSPNARPNASRTLSPNDPEPQPEPPRAHTPPLRGDTGAALQAAAPSDGEVAR